MARRRNPVFQWFVASLSLAFVKGLGRLPLGLGRRIARGAARLAYYLVPRIRQVGLANLDLAYGDTLTHAEKARILKDAVANMATVAAEFPHVARIPNGLLEAKVTFNGLEHAPRDRGAILIGAHLGNWEWAAALLVRQGLKVAAVVRPLDIPRLNDYVDGMRQLGGIRTIPKDGAAREIGPLLAEGWMVGILIDQSPRDNGVPVLFFGRPCWATVAPVLLANRARAPIHAVVMTRSRDGHYSLEFSPAIPMVNTGNPHEDLAANTQRCQDAIEARVRRDPGQWLWLHRRWKARPRLEQEWQERISRGKA